MRSNVGPFAGQQADQRERRAVVARNDRIPVDRCLVVLNARVEQNASAGFAAVGVVGAIAHGRIDTVPRAPLIGDELADVGVQGQAEAADVGVGGCVEDEQINAHGRLQRRPRQHDHVRRAFGVPTQPSGQGGRGSQAGCGEQTWVNGVWQPARFCRSCRRGRHSRCYIMQPGGGVIPIDPSRTEITSRREAAVKGIPGARSEFACPGVVGRGVSRSRHAQKRALRRAQGIRHRAEPDVAASATRRGDSPEVGLVHLGLAVRGPDAVFCLHRHSHETIVRY